MSSRSTTEWTSTQWDSDEDSEDNMNISGVKPFTPSPNTRLIQSGPRPSPRHSPSPPAPPPVTKPNPLSFSPGPCMALMTTLRTFWAPKGELAGFVVFFFFQRCWRNGVTVAEGSFAQSLMHVCPLWDVRLLCVGVELQGVCVFAV